MSVILTSLSGFNRFPLQECLFYKPHCYRDLKVKNGSVAIRGQGKSYGDAALNTQGYVLSTQLLNRFLEFDTKAGILSAESGITLAEILAVTIPAGWFLPVTPGTQYVSLGGCVAADVHGKNHAYAGSFGNHVRWLELIDAAGNIQTCSPSQNPEIFWATVGGMGLTGIIGAVSIQLIPIKTDHVIVQHYAAPNLKGVFEYLIAENMLDSYTVAWIDGLAQGVNQGRGVVMAAHHAASKENLSRRKNFSCQSWPIPSAIGKLLSPVTVQLFNKAYYRYLCAKTTAHPITYPNYFYALDKINNWNRLYGKRGFIQYQCVIPMNSAYESIEQILNFLAERRYYPFLTVLKRMGVGNLGMLSFAMQGVTIALDIPIYDDHFMNALDMLDAIVLRYGGRVYLAKDARLKPEIFRAMYPRYLEWLQIKNRIDPNRYFDSSLAQRLRIGEE